MFTVFLSIGVFIIGYLASHLNLFSLFYKELIEVQFMQHKHKLIMIFVLVSSLYCLLLFIPLERIAERERKTRQTESHISATDQLRRRGSF